MSKKKGKAIKRRSFISDTGKTLLFGTLATTAITTFFEGCKKEDGDHVLKNGDNGDHYCDDYYVCLDSRGFNCPSTGEFMCGTEIFSCYVLFTCTPENSFQCQPSSAYHSDKGGAGS